MFHDGRKHDLQKHLSKQNHFGHQNNVFDTAKIASCSYPLAACVVYAVNCVKSTVDILGIYFTSLLKTISPALWLSFSLSLSLFFTHAFILDTDIYRAHNVDNVLDSPLPPEISDRSVPLRNFTCDLAFNY